MAEMGNDDGAGYMYVEGERNEKGKLIRPGRVKFDHTLAKPPDLKEWYEKVMNNNIAVHVRNATSGDINEDNCHPYCVLSMDLGHKIDLYMMHNGMIRDVQVERGMSDSWNFATKFLRPLLAKRPSMLMEPSFIYFLCGIIGPNKLVFLDNHERFTVINEDMGSIHQPSGAWVSTKSEIRPFPKSQPTIHLPHQVSSGQNGSGSQTSVVRGKTVAWKFSDGTWELDSDGRSHFLPNLQPSPDVKPIDVVTVKDITDNGIPSVGDRLDAGSIVGRPSDDNVDFDEEGIARLMKDLPTMDQAQLYAFVAEQPLESAEVLRRMQFRLNPGLEPPAFVVAWKTALEDPWMMVKELLIVSRQPHEVN